MRAQSSNLRQNRQQAIPLIGLMAWGALVVVTLALIWGLFAAVSWSRNKLDERLNQRILEIKRLERLIARYEQRMNVLRNPGQQLIAETFLPKGESDLVLSDLQERILGLIKDGGGIVQQVQPIRKQDDMFLALGLNLRFRAPLLQAYRILYDVETLKPLLFIESCTIRLFSAQNNRLMKSGDMDVPLDIQMRVYGYMLK